MHIVNKPLPKAGHTQFEQ